MNRDRKQVELNALSLWSKQASQERSCQLSILSFLFKKKYTACGLVFDKTNVFQNLQPFAVLFSYVFLKEMFDHTHIYTLYTSLFCINADRGKFKDPVNGYYSVFIYEMKIYNLIQYKPFFRFDAKIKIHVWSNMAPKWKCWFYFDRHWLSRS